jgi:hypothetical protein
LLTIKTKLNILIFYILHSKIFYWLQKINKSKNATIAKGLYAAIPKMDK